jgi:hypothetical protein
MTTPATPSPAPVAGPVFTPEECADIKESVLAGMTPGSALVIPRGWNVIIEKLEAIAKLPAPVAGKTNPHEISSPLVDAPVAVGEKSCPWHSRYMVGCLACQAAGGEKDSAGPTPRCDAEIEALETLDRIAAWVGLKRFARTLERELAASESLRREVEAVIHNAPHSPECSSNAP